MRKLLALLLTCTLAITSLFCIFGCVKPQNEKDTLTFYAPDGAPALAIAKFINESEDFGINADIDYKVVSSSEIGPAMAQGKGDFMVIPINAASKLYNANTNNPYVMTAVITHGNLYLMSSDGCENLQDLKGKVVGVIGQGLVPDLTLKAILKDNNLLEDVMVSDTATEGKIALRYFEKAPDMIPLLKQGVLSVGLLPEPACTNLIKVANNKEWTRVDIQALYDETEKAYPQAVLMVKKSVFDKYSTQINQMEELFNQNVSWVKENTELAVNAVNSKLPQGATPSLVSANITQTVIENCKIYYQDASSSKQAVKSYIDKIIAVSAQSAKPITDDFFA